MQTEWENPMTFFRRNKFIGMKKKIRLRIKMINKLIQDFHRGKDEEVETYHSDEDNTEQKEKCKDHANRVIDNG